MIDSAWLVLESMWQGRTTRATTITDLLVVLPLLVDGGHRAVKYSRVFGVQKEVFNEGTHFVIPWFETPII